MGQPGIDNAKDSASDPSGPLEEDIAGVQGGEPDDAQDAAIALGTAPPDKPEAPFVGGGEIDWAELGEADTDPGCAE